MQIDFFEEPTEVVDKLKSKIPTLADDLDKIKGDAYKKAFTISDIAKKSLLADIQDSLVKALKGGKGFDEWRSDLFEHLQAKGWADKFESLNDDEVSVLGDSSRLKLIYDTNIRQAYAEANYEAGINSNAEFIRYVAVLDERTRFFHSSAHGLILPIDDPWWEINYPPNGFNCRCSVMFLTAQSLEARGWKPYNGAFPNIADKGFRKHSGKPYSATLKRLDKETIERIKENDEIIRKKIDLKGVDDDILERIESIQNLSLARMRRKQLQSFYKSVRTAPIKNPALKTIMVSEFNDKITKMLDLKDNSVRISQTRINHIFRDTKPQRKKPTKGDLLAICENIQKGKHLYYDNEKQNFLIFYKSTTPNKFIYVPINLNIVEDEVSGNFIGTATKITKLDFKSRIKQKKNNKKILERIK